jgi:hypothetical protein
MLMVSPKLVGNDWGSLLIFTCSKSCPESTEECLVVQYETDAIQDTEVSALKKRNKNKKRKEKSLQKKKEGQSKGKEEELKEEGKGEEGEEPEKEEEGDWD